MICGPVVPYSHHSEFRAQVNVACEPAPEVFGTEVTGVSPACGRNSFEFLVKVRKLQKPVFLSFSSTVYFGDFQPCCAWLS